MSQNVEISNPYLISVRFRQIRSALYEEYKIFSKAEFQNRWKRLHELMRKEGIDAVLITGDTNFVYVTGSETTFCYTRPLIAILPVGKEPVAVAHKAYADAVRRSSWIDDVREHYVLGAPINELVSIFEEIGLQKGTIAAEFGQNTRLGITVNEFFEIQRKLAGAKWIDCALLMETVRATKSDLEIDAMRRSSRITSKMLDRVPDLLREGMTESDAQRVLTAFMTEEGGYTPFVYVKSGPDTTMPAGASGRFQPRNSTRIMKSGYLLIDAGNAFNGYWSDFGRHYWIGNPPKDAYNFYKTNVEMLEAATSKIRPGADAADLVLASAQVAKQSGLMESSGVESTGRIGHGLGLDHCERPDINTEYKIPLQEGNVFAIEPHLESKYGIWILEHNVAVTGNGHEILDNASLELQLI